MIPIRCSVCPAIHTCVPPDGPAIFGKPVFISEAPGYDEDRKGIPLIGKIGKEVNQHYLPLAGLHREGSYFTHAIKCFPDRPKGKLDWKKEKDRELLYSCAEANLYQEIKELHPSILVPMGAFACRALDPDINLDLHHGIPLQTKYGTVFPMWHPSGGIHEPKKMLQIRTDWVRFRNYLRGNLDVPYDLFPNPDYAEATAQDISEIDPTIPLASDTEYSKRQGPYFLTYSQQPGTARLIKADRADLLVALQEKLDQFEAEIFFHNWLYDWTVTEEFGLVFPSQWMRDTMIRVFHLGNLPQGLKVLSYRLMGMEMQDFEDLVKPYSTIQVMAYYKMAQAMDWQRPEEELVIDDKTGLWKLYKPQSMSTKLKRFFTDCGKNPDKDVFTMWDNNWVNHHAELEAKVGPYPGLDIAHVPYEKASYYAMRDSDAVIRLVPILLKMKNIAHAGKLQEFWV